MSNQVFLLTLCRRRRCVFASFLFLFPLSVHSVRSVEQNPKTRTVRNFEEVKNSFATEELWLVVFTPGRINTLRTLQRTVKLRAQRICDGLNFALHRKHTLTRHVGMCVCASERAKSIHQEKW